MNRDNPASRQLLGLTAGYFLLPLLGHLCLHPTLGIPAFFDGDARRPIWVGLLGAILVGVACLALLRSARVVLAAALLVMAFVTQYYVVVASDDGRNTKTPMAITLQDSNGLGDVQVLCNGVSLGTLPVSLWESDFRAQVPEWTIPPDQPFAGVQMNGNGQPWYHMNTLFFWTPIAPSSDWRKWPPETYSWTHNGDAEFMAKMAESRYWWHFETDGFVGLKALGGLGGGGGGGLVVQEVSHSVSGIQFPAVPKVVELLLEGIRESDYRPAPEWIAYVARHRDLLFRELCDAAREDRRLEPALDAVTRAVYEIPNEPTAEEAQRVLTRILDDVETLRVITTPSIETRAIPLVAPLVDDQVYREFRRCYPKLLAPTSHGRSSSSSWESLRGSGEYVRGLAVLRALAHVDPDPVFNELVTLCARWKLESHEGLELLAILPRSGRPEARALLNRIGLDSEQTFNPSHHSAEANVERILHAFESVESPAIHQSLRKWLTRKHPDLTSNPPKFQALSRYVEHRARLEGSLDDIAGWIHSIDVKIPENQARLLLLAPVAQTRDWLAELEPRLDLNDRVSLLSHLTRHPCAEADQLMLRCIAWLTKASPSTSYQVAHRAPLLIDTPAIREYLSRQAKGEDRRWADAFTDPGDAPLPHLDWLVPTFAQWTDVSQRKVASRLLPNIGTPAAKALLAEWVRDPNPELADYVDTLVRMWEVKEARRNRRHEQLADLFAGKISPQDLLKLPALHWRDGAYVMDVSEESGSKPAPGGTGCR